MSTITIRVTSSASNPAGTGYGQSPDLNAPSFMDLIVTDSTDPRLQNGTYDAYCLNPLLGIGLSASSSYGADLYAGNVAASYAPIGFSSMSQTQVDRINWVLAQNFTADGKYSGQFNFGEVQLAIWNILGFTDAQVAGSGNDRFLNDNNRNVIDTADVNFLIAASQAAVASGHGVLPADAYFTAIIDPDGNVQPMIIQLTSAKLGNYVWMDSNGNGTQDLGELGVDNVVVELYNNSGVKIASTVTGDDYSTAAVEQGFYQFTGLAAGNYTVKFVAPTYDFTVANANSNTTDAIDSDANVVTGLSQLVTLAAAESNQTIDAGLVVKQVGKISGYVYEDVGNDGVRNSEPAIAGVTVTLTGVDYLGASVTATAVTNAAGYYEFAGLKAGTYQVVESQPAGYLDGKDTAGTTGGTVTDDQIATIPLASGQHSQENNFGELPPAKISGYVYQDVGNDGVRNSEPGIPGATVTLTGTDDRGNPVSVTTTTDANGFYQFVGLRPGTYQVVETQPAGYLDGKDTAGTTGGTVTDDKIATIPLAAGQTSAENNFGELPPAKISGYVYQDVGNDGVRNSEPAIAGVAITLTGTDDLGNPVTASTTTNAAGYYEFLNLRPGTYKVVETQPAGYLDGKDTAGTTGGTVTNDQIATIPLAAGQTSAENNFGELPLARISGYVYQDAGNDGVRNSEPAIAGVAITLTGTDDLGNPVTASTTTNAAGYYEFLGLRPGTYKVVETQPAGFLDGKDTAGTTTGVVTDDQIASIPLLAGQHSQENNFGELPPAKISGYVYQDVGNDGVRNSEPAIAGVTITLTGTDDRGNPVSVTTTTDANGFYQFVGLRPGTYQVVETQPAGYLDGKDTAGTTGGTVTDDKIATIPLAAGQTSAENNFGELPPAKISGYVYQDVGNDGVRNSEPAIAGVAITLTGTDDRGNPVTASTTTNAAGYYEFLGLRPGSYKVVETQPAGYLDGKDTAGTTGGVVTNDQIATIPLAAGQTSAENNFGELPLARISGYVYQDAGNDGVRNSEPAIAGVTITLTGTDDLGNPVTASTTTNAAGYYEFLGLRPGTYKVVETQPAGFLDGKDTAGTTTGVVTDDQIASIPLLAGQHSQENNFGELPPAKISGYVYQDVGNDGVRNGEPGIPGATVTLTGTDDRGNPVSVTTTTDANGFYQFVGLRPGTYQVVETQPAGYLDGKDTAGTTGGTVTDDKIATIPLAAGQTSAENNFGELPPAKISGYVYQDVGNDGVRNSEPAIAGVAITLTGTDDRGNPVTASTTTNAAGYYEFLGLRPGSYKVVETQPAGYLDGKDTAGTTGGVVTNDQIATIPLAAGQTSAENNFGELPLARISGYVYQDAGNDGVRNSEPAIAGVTITLTGTDDLGNPVTASTTTNAAGYYEFLGLRPGTYKVVETQPAGFLDGKDTAGTTTGVVTDDQIASIPLLAGQHSQENNFGELPPAKLSGYVYLDAGNDGVKGAGEAGIAGVTVTLTGTNDLGAPVTATATTDANGFYEFAGLRPGSYTVTETQPGAYLDGKDTAGSTGGTVANDVLSAITLVAGANSINNNFGELQSASLGDRIWVDTNGNGQQDDGATGISGLTVTLVGGGVDGLINGIGDTTATTTTGADGFYKFNGLTAGVQYQVQFSKPTGYSYTTADQGADATDSDANVATGKSQVVTLAQGENNLTIDAGVLQLASLGDRIWYDKNANGIQDTGEAGVAGVTIDLVNGAGVVVGTTTTNATGNYLFANLNPGDYHVDVREATLPAGFIFTKANQGANDAVDSDVRAITGQPLSWGVMDNTTLTSGENDLTWDAGIYKVGIDVEKYVSSTTCVTVNNGCGEGANVGYWQGCRTWQSTLGDYGWSNTGCKSSTSYNQVFGVNCTGGTQSIWQVLCSTGTTSREVFMRESVAAYLNACHSNVDYAYSKDQVCAQTKSCIDTASYDDTCRSYQRENEQGCNWTTTKTNWNCTVDTQLYDADAPPGLEVKTGSTVTFTYIVKNTGDTALSNVVLTDDRIATVTYVSGDTNSDGKLDVNETWTYRATEVAQSGTIKNTGTVTAIDSVGGVASVTDKDDAYYTGSGAAKSSLGDRVWEDKNANGVQDAGEAGISGVKVTLTGAGKDGVFGTADDITAVTATNATGNYEFNNLDAGKYTVNFAAVNGYIVTKADQGANDAADSDASVTTGTTGVITLAANEHNLTVDAGLYKLASIGDRIWYDKNANGIQDSGEAGVAGVTVELRSNGVNGTDGGVVLATTTTDANGNYLFANLTPGGYHIDVQESTLPAGFVFTKANQGANDGVDSDVRALNAQPLNWGIMDNTTLDSGENDRSWDAGVYKVGIDVEKYVSSTTAVTVNNGCGEGANVSYWQGCRTYQWSLGDYGWSDTGCKSSTSFNQVFGVNCTGGTQSIWQVLCSTGTTSREVFMRESVAAYLNACHSKVDYAYSKDQVCAQTKSCIDTASYDDTCRSYQRENEQGCNWTTTKTNWNCTVDTQLYDADAPPGLEVKTGSTVTFTYIVKNTGDTELANVVLTDDRIATVTYVSGDTDGDGKLDVNETWTYRATEVAQSGTIKNTGTVTAVDAAGGVATVTDKDDAYYTGSGAAKSSLGDRVWEDKNANGVQDAGEAGISGVKVTLKGAGKDGVFGTADDITAVTTTNANGNYEFNNLDAGKYTVNFGALSGYKLTKADQGSSDSADSDASVTTGTTGVITLGANEHNLTVDAGMFKLASVGDKVWQDSNHNWVQDAGEAGIAGIKVQLLDATGTAVLGTTTTNSTGNYTFSNLDPGSYILQFDKTNVSYLGINMNTWKWGVKNYGSNDAIDSDVNGDGVALTNVTRTDVFSLVSGQNDMTRDAAITPIVIDLDGNGIHTISRDDATAGFDLFGNGASVKSGWISGGDGFLAVDKNGNGQIDSINELFGGSAKGAGFANLASYDSNGDGLVNDADAAFGQLMIWRDLNGNHATDAGELISLAQAGVASLTVAFTELPQVDAQGNLHLERSTATMSDGLSVAMTDVYFNVSAEDAAAAGVKLPTISDLLGNDSSLDSLLGAAPAAAVAQQAPADVSTAACDNSEALRRLAALSQESCHLANAA